MRTGSLDVLFVFVAFLFAILLLLEGVSASSLPQRIEAAFENVIVTLNDDSNSMETQKTQISLSETEKRGFHATEQDDADNSDCKAANDAMLAKDASWKSESDEFETEKLPKCLGEWANIVLPAGASQYPVFDCKAPLAWSSGCYGAKGLVATVTATADFPESTNETRSRTMTFPTCFSSAKACTSSRTSADYLWLQRLEEITAWCNNQTNPLHRCGDVKITTNFWQVASLPKIIMIVVAVIGTIAAIALIVVIVVYCRWRAKREHDEAMERTLLLKLARKSALLQSRSSSYPATDTESSASLLPSSSSGSIGTPQVPRNARLLSVDFSDDTHANSDSTPLLHGAQPV